MLARFFVKAAFAAWRSSVSVAWESRFVCRSDVAVAMLSIVAFLTVLRLPILAFSVLMSVSL